MKKILLFLCIVLCYGIVNAAGSIDLSENSLSIKKGETKELVVTATNAAGLVLIKSSNEEIVTADVSKHFFDSEEDDGKVLKVKLTGVKEGNTNVEIILEDVSTYDEETLQGTKVLNVVVGDGANENDPTPTNDATPSNDVTPTPSSNNTSETEKSSNTLYYVIGGIALLLIIVMVVLIIKKKNSNKMSDYYQE